MTDPRSLDQFREAGAAAIRFDGRHPHAPLRLEQDGVVFRQMFEYPVTDFTAEVGFFTLVFGLQTIALTDHYALFTHPDGAYCLSFRRDEALPSPSVIGLKLLFIIIFTFLTGPIIAHVIAVGHLRRRAGREKP